MNFREGHLINWKRKLKRSYWSGNLLVTATDYTTWTAAQNITPGKHSNRQGALLSTSPVSGRSVTVLQDPRNLYLIALMSSFELVRKNNGWFNQTKSLNTLKFEYIERNFSVIPAYTGLNYACKQWVNFKTWNNSG